MKPIQFLQCKLFSVMRACCVAILVLLGSQHSAGAKQEGELPIEKPSRFKPWSVYVRGGGVHQFKTDIDDGGDFKVNRFFVQPGVRYSIDRANSVSFTVGYGYNDYDFSGGDGFAGLRPWGVINTLRFGIPVLWSPDDKWSVFGLPTFRFNAENGADYGDAFSSGAILGVSYKFSNRLTIGPGIGVIDQIEDDVSIIPILVIDWKLTDQLSLKTGRGLAATQGPGLLLEWRPTSAWTVGFDVRYEKFRFRLDDTGVAPRGVGQDRSIPIALSAGYSFGRKFSLALTGGIEFAGRLRLEDEGGNKIQSSDFDNAPFLGITFQSIF